MEIAVNGGEEILNKLKYGSVSGLKADENGNPLDGALIGLFLAEAEEFTEETALMTDISDENGSFRFEQVPVGNWIVREIEQPEGFVLSEELFPITVSEDEQVIEIEITNELIRGRITLVKYDADYPDHKLSGAVLKCTVMPMPISSLMKMMNLSARWRKPQKAFIGWKTCPTAAIW